MPGPFTYPVSESIYFDGSAEAMSSDNAQDGILEAYGQASAAVYTILLVYNGTLSGTQFISYSNLTPGVPIVIPIDSFFVGFTYSNTSAAADYTMEFRNNTDAGAAFYSVSKTDTKYFAQTLPTPQLFTEGSFISVKYIDDGGNSNDGVWALVFKAAP